MEKKGFSMTRKAIYTIVPLLIFAALCVLFWRGLGLNPRELPSVREGKPVPNFSLPELDGQGTFNHASLPKQWVLINFWASWCQACVEEVDFFMDLAREGIYILGINFKDDQADAKHWLLKWGNPYQHILRDIDGRTAIDFGVYGAPETYLISPQGKVVMRYTGSLNRQEWKKHFTPYIRGEKHG